MKVKCAVEVKLAIDVKCAMEVKCVFEWRASAGSRWKNESEASKSSPPRVEAFQKVYM